MTTEREPLPRPSIELRCPKCGSKDVKIPGAPRAMPGHTLSAVRVAVACDEAACGYGGNLEEFARVQRAESVPEEWRGEVCRRCHRHVVPGFSVPDSMWALVVGDRWAIVCLTCFDELAAPHLVQWDNVVEFHPVSTETWRHEEAIARA